MWADEEIDAHPDVRLETRKTYTWTHHMPVSEYIGLLRTVSQYAVAPEALRRRLFEALAPVVGDTVRLTGTTLLLVVAPCVMQACEITQRRTTVSEPFPRRRRHRAPRKRRCARHRARARAAP